MFVEDQSIIREILGDQSTDNIFRYLVSPLNENILLYEKGTDKAQSAGKLGRWHMTLDNAKGFYNIVDCEPNLTGPPNFVEYVLSPTFFRECPHLASAIYHSTFKPIFEIAAATNKSVDEVFTLYADYPFVYIHTQFTRPYCAARLEKIAFSHPNFVTTNGPTPSGVLWLHPTPAKASIKSGFISGAALDLQSLKDRFYTKYKLTPGGDDKINLETILLHAAANGALADMKILVNKLSVDISAQDVPASSLSVIESKLQKLAGDSEKVAKYESCKAFVREITRLSLTKCAVDLTNKNKSMLG